jgi:hypothetical protein
MGTLRSVTALIAVGSVLLGSVGVSLVVWTHPESRLPVGGVYFLLACLATGAISSLLFAVAASWTWMNTPAANQTDFPSAAQVTQLDSQQAPIVRAGPMRVVGRLLGAFGGLGAMYFGIQLTINAWFGMNDRTVLFPFTAEHAKAMASVCAIIACLGLLLLSRSKKKPADSAGDSQSNETKPNPDR